MFMKRMALITNKRFLLFFVIVDLRNDLRNNRIAQTKKIVKIARELLIIHNQGTGGI